MGASGWDYVVPYQANTERAFKDLQAEVLASADYIGDWSSLEEIVEAKQDEDFWEEGTHSILDMDGVSERDEFATVRALSRAETVALFGTATPTRADFERVKHTDWSLHFDRWHGRYAILHQDGTPHELVFWGYSGD